MHLMYSRHVPGCAGFGNMQNVRARQVFYHRRCSSRIRMHPVLSRKILNYGWCSRRILVHGMSNTFDFAGRQPKCRQLRVRCGIRKNR